MALPKMASRELVYENKYQQVYRIMAEFDGFTKEYFVTDFGHRCGLVVARDEHVLLVRQYRLLIDQVSWEIPGGGIDDGETPEEAAVRECLEETGVRCRDLKPLLSFHPGLDMLLNPTHLFLTHDFAETFEVSAGVTEVCQHEWIELSQCIQMVLEGKIADSLSIVALLSYRMFLSGRSS